MIEAEIAELHRILPANPPLWVGVTSDGRSLETWIGTMMGIPALRIEIDGRGDLEAVKYAMCGIGDPDGPRGHLDRYHEDGIGKRFPLAPGVSFGTIGFNRGEDWRERMYEERMEERRLERERAAEAAGIAP